MPGSHSTVGDPGGVLLDPTSSAPHGRKAPASGPKSRCCDAEEVQGGRGAPIRYVSEESLLIGIVHQGA